MECKLISKQCEETGLMGMVFDTMRISNFEDGDIFVMADAIGIAHDLIEHPNGRENICTVEDEFEALRAVWYTRGQFADLSRNGAGSMYSPEENIASDITRMARMDYGEVPDQPEGDYETEFGWIIDYARKGIPGEYDRQDYPDFDIDHYLHNALQGMRVGIVKQKKRYQNAMHANNRFWNIVAALTPYIEHLDYEGQEFILTLNDDGQVFVAEYYGDDMEEYYADEDQHHDDNEEEY